MRALLVIAMLVPCAALAQGTTYRPGPVWYTPAGQTSDAALDVRFNACGTSPNIRRGGPLTVTRAASENYVCADGVMRSAGANTLGITEAGAQVYGAGQNYVLQSEALNNASWSSAGAIVVTADQRVGPDGANTMDKLDNTAAANTDSRYQTLTVASSTGPFTVSAWVSGDTSLRAQCLAGSATGCTCGRLDGGACTAGTSGAICYAYASLGSTVTRAWATTSCTLAGTAPVMAVQGGRYGVSTGIGYIGEAQFELASTPGPYHATAGAAVSWPATVVTAPNPLPDGANWCATVQATRGLGVAWPANGGLIDTGDQASLANNFALFSDTGAVLDIRTMDATTAAKSIVSAHGFTTGSHTATGCTAAGMLTLLADGAAIGAPSGAGAGVLTSMPATLRILSGGAYTGPFNGLVQRVKVCKSGVAGRCP